MGMIKYGRFFVLEHIKIEEKYDNVNEQFFKQSEHILTNNCKIGKIINFKYMMCEKKVSNGFQWLGSGLDQ